VGVGGGDFPPSSFFGLFSKNFVRAPTVRENITSGRKDIQGLWKMQNKHKRRGQRVNDQRSDWVNQNDKTPSFHYALRAYLLSPSLYRIPPAGKKKGGGDNKLRNLTEIISG